MRWHDSFLKSEDGLVIMEWIAIAAVAFIAAFAISFALLDGADGLGGAVTDQMGAAADTVKGGS